MRYVVLLGALILVVAAPASGGSGRMVGGYGVTLALARGWHGLAAPGQLQAADFALPHSARASAQSVRVPRGHLHLIVWDYGPSVPYLASKFATPRVPLAIRRRDLAAGPMEGFPAGDAFAIRSVTINGELLEIIADLGPTPSSAARLRRVNRVLASLRVHPPRVIRPYNGQLASDGVAVRLLRGWSGRLEIPVNRQVTRVVLRAARGEVHVVLVEMSGGQGRHLDLPVQMSDTDVLRGHLPLVARRVFSNGGRSFDLSVTVAAPDQLRQANELLATLSVAPRPWTFRSCELSLRLPGTWRAAVNPRARCYPIITLSGRGIRVVLTELRPVEQANERILRRAGRRFSVSVTPRAREHEAIAVLATLKAAARR